MTRTTLKGLLAKSMTAVAMGTLLMACGEKDELYEEPSWLGNSIYERLQQDGNYSYTLRLIDDLGQKAVLSKTGSKTLFVASDSVYEAFFNSNDWGVRSYADLSDAKKKLLLNSAMVNNAYLVEMLSSVSATTPLVGQCMRRATAASVLDSVSRILPADMPNTPYWAKYKNRRGGIVLLRDNTSKPMIHFLPVFMSHNKITSQDLSILTNGVSASTADAWVNGKKLLDRDITCKNGYIQKMNGLATAADNMAEIIHSHDNMSRFAVIMDRFCAPYYDDAATKEYNRLYNNEDSVFTLKYFSSNSNLAEYGDSKGGELLTDPDGQLVDAYLPFDPGWSQYMYTNTAGRDLHYDAGAILVPTNKALDEWWNNGGGKVLQDQYGSWDNVPMTVLSKMLDISLVRSFVETVPSKFKNIVDNTNKVPIGISAEEHVDSCFMGCNGVVYLTNKVFTPAAYSSVSFPALINEETMNIIYWGIRNLDFEPYLNSMDSYYSFFIPTNTAMLTYVDPCSYGQTTTVLYEFYYNNDFKKVGARRYNYDMATQQKLEGDLDEASDDQVKNRLRDLLDNLIVIGNVEDGNTYYTTKGGSVLRIENAGREGVMTVAGGLQIENGQGVTVKTIYDQTKQGNGKSYVIEQGLPLTSKYSLYSILNGRSGCERFFELYTQGGSANTLPKTTMGGNTCVDYNCSLFDAYNYTVYVPTNETIEQMHNDGRLPYWSDYTDLSNAEVYGDLVNNRNWLQQVQKAVANRILNFMKYHIQDNAIYLEGSTVEKAKFETSTLNPQNKRFYSLEVTADKDGISVTDQLGNTRLVQQGANSNIAGREYWITNASNLRNNSLYNASDVVVHQIDGVLLYEASQTTTTWKAEVDAITATFQNNE